MYSSSSSISDATASVAQTQTTSSSVYSSAIISSSSVVEAPPAIPESEKVVRDKAQAVVSHDLKTWQEKFAKAADEGSDEGN